MYNWDPGLSLLVSSHCLQSKFSFLSLDFLLVVFQVDFVNFRLYAWESRKGLDLGGMVPCPDNRSSLVEFLALGLGLIFLVVL